jgi:hypothetical protein
VRGRLGITAEFKVDQLVVAGDWAYFEGRALGAAAGRSPAAALLRRSGGGKWEVVEAVGGTRSSGEDVAAFSARIKNSASERRLPGTLFP